MASEPAAGEQDRPLLTVERIRLMLSAMGSPRIATRVFAFVLAADADRYTATEPAVGLRVSPAAPRGGRLPRGRACCARVASRVAGPTSPGV